MYMYDFTTEYAPDEILKYLRKSRSDDPALSVEEVLIRHETILNEWTDKHLSGRIPEENCYREIVSGETIDDRPEVQKLLKRIESPKIKAVLVVEVQRLSRGDLEDAGRLIKLLRYTNTAVITPVKTYNLSDEYDRDIFERELKRGNEFLEYQKKIMNRGRLLSISQGNFIGSNPPYGYDKAWVMDGKRKCPTLKENKEQADIVRMVFDMYVNKDMGRTNICHYLDNLGIKPPKGKNWSPAFLKDMLANVHYTGKVRWNWRKTVKVVEDSEVITTRPKAKPEDQLIYDGKHEAIISEELFQAAQDKQGKNYRAKSGTKIRNPLAGLVYCKCGRAMSLRQYMKNGEMRAPRRLLCDDQVHCRTASCTYDEMADLLRDILSQTIEDFKLQLKGNNTEEIKQHEKIIINLEKKLKDIETRELSQWEAQAHPDPAQRMPQHIFQKLNEKLQEEKKETLKALAYARETMPNPTYYAKKIESFQNALAALDDPDMEPAKKNKLLKNCIERIDYNRQPSKRPRKQKGDTSYPPSNNGWIYSPIELDVKMKVY